MQNPNFQYNSRYHSNLAKANWEKLLLTTAYTKGLTIMVRFKFGIWLNKTSIRILINNQNWIFAYESLIKQFTPQAPGRKYISHKYWRKKQ